jgi:biotin-(acetyl-CoA carboxylase) ligase
MAGLHSRVKQVTYGIGVNVAFVTELITKSSEANWRELMQFDIEASTKALLMSLLEYLFLMKDLSLIIKVC